MREIFKSGSVGGAPGNRCFYLETIPPSMLWPASCMSHPLNGNKIAAIKTQRVRRQRSHNKAVTGECITQPPAMLPG
jgi:hypothetical protein